MNKNTSLLVAALIAIMGFFVYSQASIKPEMLKLETEVNPQVTQAPTGKVIEIEAGSFYFKPNILSLKKGEKVILKLKAVSMMHDFNVDALGLKIPITKSGAESVVEFTPNKIGEFEYYCSIGSHRANGQVGKLIVVE